MRRMIATTAALALLAGAALAQQGGGGMSGDCGPGAMMESAQDMGRMPMMRGQGGPGMMDRNDMMRGYGRGMMDDDMMRGGHGHGGMRGMMEPHMMVMMMAMMDQNGNGTLSLDEINAVHARMFAYVDENGDGELSPQEIRDFMRGGVMMDGSTDEDDEN